MHTCAVWAHVGIPPGLQRLKYWQNAPPHAFRTCTAMEQCQMAQHRGRASAHQAQWAEGGNKMAGHWNVTATLGENPTKRPTSSLQQRSLGNVLQRNTQECGNKGSGAASRGGNRTENGMQRMNTQRSVPTLSPAPGTGAHLLHCPLHATETHKHTTLEDHQAEQQQTNRRTMNGMGQINWTYHQHWIYEGNNN